MAPKNWQSEVCSEPRNLSVFGLLNSVKLKKPEEFFPGEEYGELAVKKSE